MSKKIELNAGDTVWVIERDEELVPGGVIGLLFLAEVAGYVIASAFPYGYELLEDQLEYFAEKTRQAFEDELKVYPSADCFASHEEAAAAMEAGT
ncbi:MAG: hypothetical protein Q4E45_02395 [Eubacteriales bacterium]|nr:hypothetical protein [Eubacteriales bacterium]